MEILTAAGAVIVALAAGYLVDARWVKERRLEKYADFLDALTGVLDAVDNGKPVDQVKVYSTWSQVRLVASWWTWKAALNVIKAVPAAMVYPPNDQAINELHDRVGLFAEHGRLDVTLWLQRGPRHTKRRKALTVETTQVRMTPDA